METWPEGALFTQVKGGGTYRHPANPKTLNQDNYFTMSGPQIYKMARKKVYDMIKNILSNNKLNLNNIKLVIPHQASGTAVQAYSKIGGFKSEQIMDIIDKYGNCVSASIPLALSIAVENRKINRSDLIIMIGTGAGLSVSGCLIKF